MTTSLYKPSVLAITNDLLYLKNIRLSMPLLNLKRQGLIADFFITNSLLLDLPDEFRFDVVWLQRIDDANLISLLAEKIDSHYIYDLDDLLIAKAFYRDEDMENKSTVLAGIRQCQTLTLTSARQMDVLQKYLPFPIASKSVVCPNGFEFSNQTRVPLQPQGIILTSSDSLPLTTSYDPVLGSLAAFTQRYNLPIYYFGKNLPDINFRFPNAVKLGMVPYWHYQALLSALPAMIGIAPSETVADQETLDFINCKSDVKMMEFGGFGHPAVYSNAPPYVDTDLQAGIAVENTASAWQEGLEKIYHELWQKLDIEQRQIMELRNMTKIAQQCWYKAISQARLPRPMNGGEIRPHLGKVDFFRKALRHIVFSQDSLFLERLHQQVPPGLIKIIKIIKIIKKYY